jgi:hypothetical protein
MRTNDPSNKRHPCSSNSNRAVLHCDDIEVSRTGYELWRAAGRPAGRYMEFLALAEEQKKNSDHSAPANSTSKRSSS